MIINFKKKRGKKDKERRRKTEEENNNTTTSTLTKTPWSSKSFLVLKVIFLYKAKLKSNLILHHGMWEDPSSLISIGI